MQGSGQLITLKIATWNTEWRKRHSRDAGLIRERLAAVDSDIVVLTETHFDFLEDWEGYSICGPEEYGEARWRSCRSVLLWSKWPWTGLDTVGSPGIIPGCYVKAISSTPFGEIPVAGIIIPYHMSNVTHGTGDRRAWEDHESSLDALHGIVRELPTVSLVMGDFNQRIPFAWGSRRLNKKLLDTFSPMEIMTGGPIEPIGDLAIDHIACGRAWKANRIEGISNIREDGGRVSDHFGLFAELRSSTP